MAIVVAGLLGVAAAGCGGGDDGAAAEPETATAGNLEQPQAITGGITTLDLDDTTVGVLDALGVSIEPTGNAELTDGRLRFPITEGSVDVDTLSGRIEHDGGLRFSAAGRSLQATDLVIHPGRDVLEAEIAGQRVPLLGIDVRTLQTPVSDTIVLPGTAAALSPATIPALEERLGVQLPDADLPLGRVQVSGKR